MLVERNIVENAVNSPVHTTLVAAVQAGTGDLQNLHDYTLAATEASTATQLTTAVRNKALEAFNEIMRMPI